MGNEAMKTRMLHLFTGHLGITACDPKRVAGGDVMLVAHWRFLTSVALHATIPIKASALERREWT
jgi:hypothetical protein